MRFEAFITENDGIKVYDCTYYHDPNKWNEFPDNLKPLICENKWSQYIKYLDNTGKISDEIKHLPNNQGGIYLFYIQGQPIPSFEMFLVYIGRALYTNKGENINKRVRHYYTESKNNRSRPKIKRLFKYWKDFLYIKYLPSDDNEFIKAGESSLIRAILPPFNDEIPDRIEYKQGVNAF